MKRILIVDDVKTSYLMMKILLDGENDFEIVGWSKNGQEAVRMARELQPDLISMDLEMPKMNGLEATRTIMANNPTPIAIVSSHANNFEKNLTYNALNEGALAVVAKPGLPVSPNYEILSKQLLKSLRSIVKLKIVKPLTVVQHKKSTLKSTVTAKFQNRHYRLIALGCSAGGPNALLILLDALPKNLPVPIVIVQHISVGFLEGLVNWLQNNVSISLKIAVNGEVLKSGVVYFAPDNMHLIIQRGLSQQLISRLDDTEPKNGFKPSVTVLFDSIAKNCAKDSINGILTGMGKDGGDGLLAVRNSEGKTFTQDEASALVYGMPRYAIDIGAVEDVVKLENMAEYLCKLLD